MGLKRIGLAICFDESIVFPQKAVLRKNRNQASRDIDVLLDDWEIDTLVIGIPKSNEETKRRIKHFSTLLSSKREIVFQDESMSSVEAKEQMAGAIKQKRDGRIDSIAAKIILERFLSL